MHFYIIIFFFSFFFFKGLNEDNFLGISVHKFKEAAIKLIFIYSMHLYFDLINLNSVFIYFFYFIFFLFIYFFFVSFHQLGIKLDYMIIDYYHKIVKITVVILCFLLKIVAIVSNLWKTVLQFYYMILTVPCNK